MHNIHVIAVIFVSCVVFSINAAPLETTVYNKLVELSKTKCPYMKTTKLLDPKIVKNCSGYATIKSITVFDRTTKDNVPCLFYYNNFALLCDIAAVYDITKIVNDAALKTNNLSNTCAALQSVQLIPEFVNATDMLTGFKKPMVCEKLCTDFFDNSLTPICSLAASTINIIKMVHNQIIEKTKAEGAANPPNQSDETAKIKDSPPKQPKTEIQPHPVLKSQKPINLNVDNKPQQDSHSQPAQNQKKQVNDETVEQVSQDQASAVQAKEVNNQNTPAENEEAPHKQDNVAKSEEVKNNQDVPSNPGAQLNEIENGESPKLDAQQSPPENTNVQVAAPPVPPLKVEESKPKSESASEDTKVVKEPAQSAQKPSSVVSTSSKPSTESAPVPVQDLDKEEDSNEEFNEEDGNADVVPPLNANTMERTEKIRTNTKPSETDEDVMPPTYNNPNDEEDSFFFIYFMMVCAVFILGYIGYHNKQKVLALVIEGRRGRRGSRRGRPNSANYHKLDSNLEEAVTSSCNKNTTNIIY